VTSLNEKRALFFKVLVLDMALGPSWKPARYDHLLAFQVSQLVRRGENHELLEQRKLFPAHLHRFTMTGSICSYTHKN